MKITLLRTAYATVLLGSAAFVTVGPYGAWPIPGLAEQAAAIAETIEAAIATRIEVPQPEIAATCPDTTCGKDTDIAIVLPSAPPATVVTVVETATSPDTTEPATVGLAAATIAVAAPIAAVSEPVVKAVINHPSPADQPRDDAVHATAPTHDAAPAVPGAVSAKAISHPAEMRHRVAAEKQSVPKKLAAKPQADSDWAIRQVFNRGG